MNPLLKAGEIDYGLDSPRQVRFWIIIGAVSFLGTLAIRPGDLAWLLIGPLMAVYVFGLLALLRGFGMYLSSYLGKPGEVRRMIDAIPWRGDETVLDIGCGRGLVAIAAARKLTTGKVHGIDTWREEDLTDNWAEATIENAKSAGVEDRIEVETADVRQMPFEDGKFDVILSCLALHNSLHNSNEREIAMTEVFRVLKPGGRLCLLETGRTDHFVRALREAGCRNSSESGMRLKIFPPARRVTATKPADLPPPPFEPAPKSPWSTGEFAEDPLRDSE